MAANKKSTVEKVEQIVSPIAKDLDLDIWDIRYLKEGASWFLRIFIDKDGGVDIDDCERMSRAIDQPLDDADIIKEQYFLEVSSPGLFRELVKPEHFERFKGESVTVRLIRPIDGVKEFSGILLGFDGTLIKIGQDELEKEFERSAVAKVFVNDEI